MHLVEINRKKTQRRVWFAYAMLVLMNILDLLYTSVMLTLDKTTEANPFMEYVYYQSGIEGMVLVKGVFLITLGMLLRYLPVLHPIYSWMFYFVVGAYAILSLYHGFWFFGSFGLL